MNKYYEITVIRSRRAAERERYKYPNVVKTDSKHKTLEMALFNYEHLRIGMETDKELRLITEADNGQVVSDELIQSTY